MLVTCIPTLRKERDWVVSVTGCYSSLPLLILALEHTFIFLLIVVYRSLYAPFPSLIIPGSLRNPLHAKQ